MKLRGSKSMSHASPRGSEDCQRCRSGDDRGVCAGLVGLWGRRRECRQRGAHPGAESIGAPDSHTFGERASRLGDQDRDPGSEPVLIIIALRGKQALGSTFIPVLARDCDQLDKVGSALMLAGLTAGRTSELETRSTHHDRVGLRLHRDTLITESPRQALAAAEACRATRPGDSRHPG